MNAALRTGQAVETRLVFATTDGDDLTRLSGAPASPHAVPEALINAMFSYLLGVDLPGQGTNYLKQETEFVSDAAYGEPLSARVEITRLRPDNHLVDLETTCRAKDGRLIARGRALVLARDVAGAWD